MCVRIEVYDWDKSTAACDNVMQSRMLMWYRWYCAVGHSIPKAHRVQAFEQQTGVRAPSVVREWCKSSDALPGSNRAMKRGD